MRRTSSSRRTATILLTAFVVAMPASAGPRPEGTERPVANAVQEERMMETIESLRGSTVRWTFTEGPTAGTVYEHTFREDGTVVWRVLEGPGAGRSAEESEYAAVAIDDHVHAVSYLGESGYTLTVILNFDDGNAHGFASNDKEWHPLSGTFEVVEDPDAGNGLGLTSPGTGRTGEGR